MFAVSLCDNCTGTSILEWLQSWVSRQTQDSANKSPCQGSLPSIKPRHHIRTVISCIDPFPDKALLLLFYLVTGIKLCWHSSVQSALILTASTSTDRERSSIAETHYEFSVDIGANQNLLAGAFTGKVTLTAPFHHSYHHTAIYKADKLSAGTSSRRSGDSGRLGSSRRVGSSERSQGKVSGRAPLLLSSLSPRPRATGVFHKTKSNAGIGRCCAHLLLHRQIKTGLQIVQMWSVSAKTSIPIITRKCNPGV
ncbi:hypothetical protein PO909_013950 [Leuciscus waleckii]